MEHGNALPHIEIAVKETRFKMIRVMFTTIKNQEEDSPRVLFIRNSVYPRIKSKCKKAILLMIALCNKKLLLNVFK